MMAQLPPTSAGWRAATSVIVRARPREIVIVTRHADERDRGARAGCFSATGKDQGLLGTPRFAGRTAAPNGVGKPRAGRAEGEHRGEGRAPRAPTAAASANADRFARLAP